MTFLALESIKKIYHSGYKIYFLNDNIQLKKSDIIEDYFFFEIILNDSILGKTHILNYSLNLLTYDERKKIYIEESFYDDAISKL